MTQAIGHTSQQAAFARLLTSSHVKLHGYVRSALFQRQHVDDLMQEIATVAWERFDEFEMGTSFDAWILSIARFQILKHVQKRQRDRLQFSEGVLETISEVMASQRLRTEQLTLTTLDECVAKLQSNDRHLLYLRFNLGQTGKAIAKDCGWSQHRIGRSLHRIYALLLLCMRRTQSTGVTS